MKAKRIAVVCGGSSLSGLNGGGEQDVDDHSGVGEAAAALSSMERARGAWSWRSES